MWVVWTELSWTHLQFLILRSLQITRRSNLQLVCGSMFRSSVLDMVSPAILDKTVDTNPLPPKQCWFWVARRAHFVLITVLRWKTLFATLYLGGRGVTNPNLRHLFRLFNGQLAFFGMCQQVLSTIVGQYKCCAVLCMPKAPCEQFPEGSHTFSLEPSIVLSTFHMLPQ